MLDLTNFEVCLLKVNNYHLPGWKKKSGHILILFISSKKSIICHVCAGNSAANNAQNNKILHKGFIINDVTREKNDDLY